MVVDIFENDINCRFIRLYRPLLRCPAYVWFPLPYGRPYGVYEGKRGAGLMRLYHSSSVVVERPDLDHSRKYLNVGRVKMIAITI